MGSLHVKSAVHRRADKIDPPAAFVLISINSSRIAGRQSADPEDHAEKLIMSEAAAIALDQYASLAPSYGI
jgi:hypothetical protein